LEDASLADGNYFFSFAFQPTNFSCAGRCVLYIVRKRILIFFYFLQFYKKSGEYLKFIIFINNL